MSFDFAALRQNGSCVVPLGWIKGLASTLDRSSKNAELIPLTVAAARALPLTRSAASEITPGLLLIAADASNSDDLRLGALAAVPGGLAKPDESLFAFLLGKLPPTEAVANRTRPQVPGEDGLRALELALAILAKIEEHAKVVAQQIQSLP